MRNKLRLWKDSITKTKVYLDVEKFLREEIQRNRDFQCICQSCYKKVMTNISSRREYQESFQEGQKVAAVQFSRIRTKCSSFDKSPSKTSFLNSVAVMNNMGKQFWIKKSRGWWYVPMLFSYFVAIVPYLQLSNYAGMAKSLKREWSLLKKHAFKLKETLKVCLATTLEQTI